MARAEGIEVGDDARERGLRLDARLAAGDAGPLLGLRRLERAGERARQADRQHAVVDEAGGADGERRLDDVVPAEDQVAQLDQAGVRERRAHRDQTGRLGEPRGDRGGARHRGRRDRPATADKPYADPTLYVHVNRPFFTARA